MALTTKLIIWNAALREIGSAPLANTTDVNTRQFELAGAWDHAVEHALALEDWGFARRRSSLIGVSDTSYPLGMTPSQIRSNAAMVPSPSRIQ